MFAYIKTRWFPVHLLLGWWIGWIVVSCTGMNEFVHPSWETVFQFLLLVLMFYLGYRTIEWRWSYLTLRRVPKPVAVDLYRMHMHRYFVLAMVISCIALVFALIQSGAFSTEFFEYFLKVRRDEATLGSLTGIHFLDVSTKILIFPLSYSVLVVILGGEAESHKSIILLCITNFLLYSYLWQVNYPLVHLFWLLIFHWMLKIHRTRRVSARVLAGVGLLFVVLLASAANRFGGDLVGGLQRYIVGYHLIGFSFYDYQLHDPKSILHIHTFGRSSLGFLDQLLEGVSKTMDLGYKSASFENATFNNDAIDIGIKEVKEFNAFGTFLFGFYRDFNLAGIIGGGYLYGLIVTNSLYKSAQSWMHGAIFIILASSWMMGMMVNPLEQAYFGFAFVLLGMIFVVNRIMPRRTLDDAAGMRLTRGW